VTVGVFEGLALGEAIRVQRDREQLDNTEVARRLGLSERTLERIVHHETESLKYEYALDIAKFLGCGIERIYEAYDLGKGLRRKQVTTTV
jgi:plasmid maintenance system antidote protein VapI